MACLRRQAAKGRVGAFQCDEEGCKLFTITVDGRTEIVADPPEIDCVLQLRLRAGDSKEAVRKGADLPENSKVGRGYELWKMYYERYQLELRNGNGTVEETPPVKVDPPVTTEPPKTTNNTRGQ